jgi:hypothetical protein
MFEAMHKFLYGAFFQSVGKAFNSGETDILSREVITMAREGEAAWYVGEMPDESIRSGGYFVGAEDVIAFSVRLGE